MKESEKLALASTVERNPELISSEMDGETVMMSIENGKYYGIDKIGTRIWELLENSHEISELCVVLLEEFEVDRKQCESDVLTFLNDLLKENIITVKNEN